jgi:hypothetical protein
MSKQIDWSQPLSDEERRWAEQFPGMHGGMLAAHAEQFPAVKEETLDGEDAEEAPYSEWNKSELEVEAKRRNAEEGKSLPVTGTKPQLVKVLEEDDEASA